jgi:hypothetical protein
MKDKLLKVAKYLGSQGLYEEAAQIKKMAQEVVVENDYESGGKIFSFRTATGIPYYFNSGTGILSGNKDVAVGSVDWGGADDPVARWLESNSQEFVVDYDEYINVLEELLRIGEGEIGGQDSRIIKNHIASAAQKRWPTWTWRIGALPEASMEGRYNPPVESIRVDGDTLYYTMVQFTPNRGRNTIYQISINLTTGEIKGNLTNPDKVRYILDEAWRRKTIPYFNATLYKQINHALDIASGDVVVGRTP